MLYEYIAKCERGVVMSVLSFDGVNVILSIMAKTVVFIVKSPCSPEKEWTVSYVFHKI